MATRACAIFTAMCCLSFVAVSAEANAQEQGANSGGGFPDFRVFAFGTMETENEGDDDASDSPTSGKFG